jgi:Histidine kinase-, DNA gyrase B-, and HSP90-like ATPase
MARQSKGHEVIPSARRLIKSLRDMGYDFASAAADLVDNSIEAGATLVAIDVEFDGDDSWVRIADNGQGMTTAELKEAMRYGAEREYEEEDLGKFGLGLKTASMSQCKRLSVASRTNPQRADVSAFCWDMDHIEKTNRWEILPLERNGLGPAIRGPLKDSTGTVVLWQKLDRILGYRHPYGESARKRLSAMCRELEQHLSMVFHRFLSGEVRGKRFKILLNGNEVNPWDPFARNEPRTKRLTPVQIKLEHEGVRGEIGLDPFVLPHQDDFSSPEAFKSASGPSSWNQQQGFYIYRAGRLIQSGGWCRLRTLDEHTKLARVGLSFSPALDEAFKINVAKMRVQLPMQIREQVEQAIKPLLKIAQETYRRGSIQSVVKPSSGATHAPAIVSPSPSINSPQQVGGQLPGPMTVRGQSEAGTEQTPASAQRLWTLDELQAEIEHAAEPNERAVVARVFRRFRSRTAS